MSTTVSTEPASTSPSAPVPLNSMPASSISALATAAGVTQSAKHRHLSLHTPLAADYPSAIQTPAPPFSATTADKALSSASLLSAGGKTPLTPPSAYLDWLKIHSPVAPPTPASSGTRGHFTFSTRATSVSNPVPTSANLSGRWTGRDKWPRPSYTSSSSTIVSVQHERSPQRPVLNSNPSAESTVSTLSTLSSNSGVSTGSLDSDGRTATGPEASVCSPDVDGKVGLLPRTQTQTRSLSDSQVPTLISTTPPSTISVDPKTGSASSTNDSTTTACREGEGLHRRPCIIIPPSARTPMPVPLVMAHCAGIAPVPATGTTRTTISNVRQVITRTVTRSRPIGTHEVGGGKGTATDGGSQGDAKPMLVGEAPKGKRRRMG